MKTHARTLIGLAAVALAFALIAVAVAPHSRSGPVTAAPEAPGTCTDLARDVDPSKVPVDSGYDPEQDVVYAHHAGRTYVMRPNDPVCRALAPARGVIDDMMNAHRENMVAACRFVRGLVASKLPSFRGRALDLQAAQRFLVRRCATVLP